MVDLKFLRSIRHGEKKVAMNAASRTYVNSEFMLIPKYNPERSRLCRRVYDLVSRVATLTRNNKAYRIQSRFYRSLQIALDHAHASRAVSSE